MEARFYSFSKRNNSTKIPDGSGVIYNINLKQNTSILSPTISVDFAPYNYNYVFIPSFSRYYHISNWFYSDGLWWINLTEDYLASYKNQIGNTYCNILYASNSNRNIVDKRIPITAGIRVDKTIKGIEGFVITGINNQGAVILGITGKGSFGQYLMQDSTKVSELLDGVDDWWGQGGEAAWDATKQLFYGGSAADCLKSAIALPLLLDSTAVGASSSEEIYLGGYPTGEYGYKIQKPIYERATTINIPWHHSGWMRNPPYSEVIVYVPFIGVVTLPTADLINDDTLAIIYSLNTTSGDLSVEIKGGNTGKIVNTSSTNIAMATPYGSTGVNGTKIAASITAGLGAAIAGAVTIATGGAAAPAALGIAGGLATAAAGTISGLGGSSSGSGGLGGGASQGLDLSIQVYVISRELSDSQANFNSIMGKPYMAANYPKNFAGFIMTEGFKLDAAVSDSEKDAVNTLLDTGIYYE